MNGRLLIAIAIFTAVSQGCRSSGARPATAQRAQSAARSAVQPATTENQSAFARQTAFTTTTTEMAESLNNVQPLPDPNGPNRPLPEELPRQPLRVGLADAIELSLAQNPDLIALRRNEGVAIGVMGVAQTYPFNPYVQFQATPLQHKVDGGTGATYHYVLLMQTLQLAHQQRYRDQIGSTSLNTVRWNIHQAELLNLAQTERLYFTALFLRGVRDLTQANARLNTELLSILERQLAAGAVAGADVAIVRLDYRSTQHQFRLAEQNYETALLDLRRQLNLPPSVAFELVGDLTQYTFLPAAPERLSQELSAGALKLNTSGGDDPLRQIIRGRPDVLAAQSDVDTARANERLANASRTADLQIGPYYQRTESGTDYYGFRGQTDLMIINNGMPLLRQRQAELRQRYTVWQQLQVRATLEAEAAIERYERARKLLALLGNIEDAAVPVELEKLEAQFQAGEVDILRLFTARTSVIQNRRAQLDTLNEVAQAAAQVTVATAAPPQVLAVARRPQSK